MEHAPDGTVFDSNGDPLEHRIATALAKIGLALKQQAFRSAGDRGLSPTQGQILALISTHEKVRPSELAAKLGVSMATVSESVRTLVQKGFVEKTTDARNARSVVLDLTSAGTREAQRASDWPDFLARAVDCLTVEEQEAFLHGLLKMIRTLQERGEIPIARMCITCTHFRAYAHATGRHPHHCALVDAPMGKRHLRIECAEHETADGESQRTTWLRFVRGPVVS